MQKIIPHLWFDHQAEEAVSFYTSIFQNSSILRESRYGEAGAKVSGVAEGTIMNMTFQLAGQEFMALNGGPYFTFTPALSFFVNGDTEEEINENWEKLTPGGTILMELDTYPFSEKFGWVQDKFGISWQLNLASRKQKIAPFLMFAGQQHGKAEEAINQYISLFPNSGINEIEYNEDAEGTVKRAAFTLGGQEFMAIDGGNEHSFTFTEAISLFVNCTTQEEVDMLWEKLSEGGEQGQCGWLKDKHGVSWQIVPTALGEMLNDSDPVKSKRVIEAMLRMKKIEIAGLREAYEGS
ncbi:VOC family protein [Ectobacillus sp. sgz5001026]|uniref:VOC family protein n=1 Tax=Ectobacillus sp. sgz5001026 TaxID=3242473 RepID=UPI0036D33207